MAFLFRNNSNVSQENANNEHITALVGYCVQDFCQYQDCLESDGEFSWKVLFNFKIDIKILNTPLNFLDGSQTDHRL